MKRIISLLVIAALSMFMAAAHARPACKPGDPNCKCPTTDEFICPPEATAKTAAPTTATATATKPAAAATASSTKKPGQAKKAAPAPTMTRPPKPRCPKDEYSDEFICPPEEAKAPATKATK